MKDDGKRVVDRGGHHVVVEMQNITEKGKLQKGHVYVKEFEQIKKGVLPKPGTNYLPAGARSKPARPESWYKDVRFDYVRMEKDRTGSSQGDSIPSGNNTPSSTNSGGKGKGKAKSPAYGNSNATAAVSEPGWAPIPGGNGYERFFDGNAWVQRLRYPNGQGGYVTSDEHGQFQASASQTATLATVTTDQSQREGSATSTKSQWVPIGDKKEQWFSSSRNEYVNKYRQRKNGKWEEYSLKRAG